MPKKVTFYIDGFNFYNGLKDQIRKDPSWKQFYWIDFVQLCKQFLGKNQILESVKYFTATPREVGKELRQSALFKANALINKEKIDFIRGKYYKKKIRCQSECRRYFEIYEEKQTDVNISVQMMGDCAFNKTDTLVLISADSDMVPTIVYIKNHWPDKKIKVYFPPCRKSTDLINIMGDVVFLDSNLGKWKHSKMEQSVDVGGLTSKIPEEWRV